MSQRVKNIAERIASFRDEAIAYIRNLTDDDWMKVCDWEQWTVGVTARHLGAGHLAIFDLAGMIVKGEDLPQLTMDQIHEMSKKDAREHPDCTREDALTLLKQNGDKMISFVSGLSDEDLDRKGHMPAFGGEFTTEQFIDMVIFDNANQHFNSMKSAVAS